MSIMREASGSRVEAAQAAAPGAEPEDAFPVFIERVHIRMTQAVGRIGIRRIVGELSGSRIETTEAVIGRGDPDVPLAVFDHAPDFIAADAVGIVGVILHDLKFLGVPVPLADPGLRGDPQCPAPVFIQGKQRGNQQAARVARLRSVVNKVLRFRHKAVQAAAIGTDPEIPYCGTDCGDHPGYGGKS